MSDSKPLIGVTTYRQPAETGVWKEEFALVPSDYLRGVEKEGGIPVLIPPQQLSVEEAARILQGLDGLLLCGGRDVDPSRYGDEPLATTDEPDLLRDMTEDALLAAALDSGLPIFAICRGAQILNVHLGGSLIQHLPDKVGDTRYQRGGGEFTMMPVSITPHTQLSALLDGQESLESVAMYHHQAIDRLGAGVVVSAMSEDGVVEAIEVPSHPFCIAVQWHPEKTLADSRLFRALVTEASQGKKNA